MLRTVRQVFDDVALFVAGRQGIVVASNHPLMASRKRLAELSTRPAIRAHLSPRALAQGGLVALLDELMLSGPELDQFIADSARDGAALVSTDENLYLEYATPRGNIMRYDASLARTMDLLAQYRRADAPARHLVP